MILAPSQWETALFCNDVSHWLGGKPRISSDYVVLIIIPEFDDGWTWISNHVLQRSLKWNYSSIGQPFTSKCEHISAEWSFHPARVIYNQWGDSGVSWYVQITFRNYALWVSGCDCATVVLVCNKWSSRSPISNYISLIFALHACLLPSGAPFTNMD